MKKEPKPRYKLMWAPNTITQIKNMDGYYNTVFSPEIGEKGKIGDFSKWFGKEKEFILKRIA